MQGIARPQQGRFQHTAARRRLLFSLTYLLRRLGFQHTAARRRLLAIAYFKMGGKTGFNTQPHGGGCWRVRENACF